MFHCLAMGQISWCHYRCPKFCLLRKFPLSIILHDTRGWERTFLLYYSKSLFPVDNYGVLGVFFGFEQSQTHFASLGLLHHTNIFKNVIFCQKKKNCFLMSPLSWTFHKRNPAKLRSLNLNPSSVISLT